MRKSGNKRRQGGKTTAKNDTITTRLYIDKRGRIQLKKEDRDFLQIEGGELLEVTIKRADTG